MSFLRSRLGGFFCIAMMVSAGILAADGRPVDIELKPLPWEAATHTGVVPLVCVARNWVITFEDRPDVALDSTIVQSALAALPKDVKVSIHEGGAYCFFGRLSRPGTSFVEEKNTFCLIFVVNSKCAVFNLRGESLLKDFGTDASDAYSLKESLNFDALFCTVFLRNAALEVASKVSETSSFIKPFAQKRAYFGVPRATSADSSPQVVCRLSVPRHVVPANAGPFDYRKGAPVAGFPLSTVIPLKEGKDAVVRATAGDFAVKTERKVTGLGGKGRLPRKKKDQ